MPADDRSSAGAQPFKPKLGPSPAVPMQYYRPAVPGKNPVQIMRNPNKPQHNGHNGPMQYGNAAKGVRQQPRPEDLAPTHRDHLQSVLTGQAKVMAAQQASRISGYPRVHAPPSKPSGHAHPVQHVVKSPVKTHVSLPTVAGQSAGSHEVGGEGGGRGGHGGRGRGRGNGRGRGRGRGGGKAA